MTTTFNLPDLGEGLQEAEIVEWKVKEGDTVAVDDPLVAVETDKAVVDVPSPYAGKIKKLHWKNGDVVPTHSALVDFATDEATDGEDSAESEPAAEKSEAPKAAAKPAAKKSSGGESTTFNLPDLGEGLQEAEIVEWKVKKGDTVAVDDPLVAVETDKAVVDVPSPYAGTILKLHWKNGDVVPTHSALVDFSVEGTADEDNVAEESTDTREKGAEKEGKGDDSGTVVGKMTSSDEELEDNAVIRKKGRADGNRRERGKASTAARIAAPARTVVGTGRPKASPATRVYAKECGCDLTQVEGTGSKGQITKADVDVFMQSGGSRQQVTAAGPMGYAATDPWDVPAHASGIEYDRPQQLKGPRRAMHKSMTAARDQVMECTLFDDADIHGWMPGQDITARIIRAVVAGCRTVPQMNAWYDGEKMEMTVHKRVDLAMAVDTPDGLIVPVLRNADSKNGQQLREDLNVIKQKTRDRSVAPEDMKNPTITLSNFGMMAGRYATPVVVPPQVAILGTGGLRHDVVAVMGGIETHRRIPLSITFDHRCLTGGEACRWLAAVIKDLEKPY